MIRIAFTFVFVAAVFAQPACVADIGGRYTAMEREDLQSTTFTASIHDGLSDVIEFEIRPDTESFLVEIEGEKGLYSLVEFRTPSKVNLIQEGDFRTRSPQAYYGLANWLFPNQPGLSAESGTYRMILRGYANQDGSGTVTESVTVRILEKLFTSDERCGLEVDVLVDDSALDINEAQEAAKRILVDANRHLAQAGIHIVNFQPVSVNLKESNLDLEQRSVVGIVDDVLAQARRQGYSRDGGLRVVLVHSIGGEKDPNGRSLGLPGPYTAARPNSAVLLATENFATNGVLDTNRAAETLAHEIGHYLGLYHTSEPDRNKHDPLTDTAECTANGCGASYNQNLMLTGTGGVRRSAFTEQQATVMQNHPLCVPLSQTSYVEPEPLPDCDLECEAPTTCVYWNDEARCLEACDPPADDTEFDECDLVCTTSDDNVYVCAPLSDEGSSTF